jgi:hypothetical protein
MLRVRLGSLNLNAIELPCNFIIVTFGRTSTSILAFLNGKELLNDFTTVFFAIKFFCLANASVSFFN